MRNNKKMVSLNPEYKIEVTTLTSLAEKIKDDNPELCTILSVLCSSILAEDEKKLVKYINKYLEDKIKTDNIKDEINKMLGNSFDSDLEY